MLYTCTKYRSVHEVVQRSDYGAVCYEYRWVKVEEIYSKITQ